jgi:hypothetical protein
MATPADRLTELELIPATSVNADDSASLQQIYERLKQGLIALAVAESASVDKEGKRVEVQSVGEIKMTALNKVLKEAKESFIKINEEGFIALHFTEFGKLIKEDIRVEVAKHKEAVKADKLKRKEEEAQQKKMASITDKLRPKEGSEGQMEVDAADKGKEKVSDASEGSSISKIAALSKAVEKQTKPRTKPPKQTESPISAVQSEVASSRKPARSAAKVSSHELSELTVPLTLSIKVSVNDLVELLKNVKVAA